MDFVQISKTVLFQGTRPEDAEAMLKCLEAREKQFQKDETIYYVGDRVSELGLVLSGSVLIENDDLWGNRSILDRIGPGQIFAETYALRARGKTAGDRDSGRKNRSSVPERGKNPQSLYQCLQFPCQTDPESADAVCPKKSEPVPEDLSHFREIDPGTAFIVSVLAGSQTGQPGV